MTSRERILAALNHKEPDKLPVDCGAMRSTGIMGIAYNALKKHLGVQGGRTQMCDMMQQLCYPEEWFLDRFEIDAVDFGRGFIGEESDWVAWNLPDGSEAYRPAWGDFRLEGDTWVGYNTQGEAGGSMPPGSTFFNRDLYPLQGSEDPDIPNLRYNMSRDSWNVRPESRHSSRSDFREFIGRTAKTIRANTERAIMLSFGGALFEGGQKLYGTEEFLMNLYLQEHNIHALLDAMVDYYLEGLEPLLAAVGDTVDIIHFGDDLGTQTSLMMSPEAYRGFFFKRHKRMFDYVHRHSDAKVFFHSCGAVATMIPDLIDAGVDILNPVQIGASGMNPETLKKEYGRDIVFWGGGVDTQHSMPHKSPVEIADEVKRNCEILMKDGGFVFNQVHNLVAGTPPENIVAMFDAANSIRY